MGAKEIKTEEITVRQWLNTLKEPYKTKALTNSFNNASNDILESTSKTLIASLYCAFEWDRSSEGFEYWQKIAQSIEETE